MWRFIESHGRNEKPQGVTENSDQEDAAVKRHEGEHDQISEANPEDMQKGLNQTGHDMVRTGFDEAGVGEQLHENGHDENEDQGQHVHSRFTPGPVVEENIRVFPPEEGHVHHHLMVHHHRHGGAICRWRRWGHPSHAVHMPIIHDYGL